MYQASTSSSNGRHVYSHKRQRTGHYFEISHGLYAKDEGGRGQERGRFGEIISQAIQHFSFQIGYRGDISLFFFFNLQYLVARSFTSLPTDRKFEIKFYE